MKQEAQSKSFGELITNLDQQKEKQSSCLLTVDDSTLAEFLALFPFGLFQVDFKGQIYRDFYPETLTETEESLSNHKQNSFFVLLADAKNQQLTSAHVPRSLRHKPTFLSLGSQFSLEKDLAKIFEEDAKEICSTCGSELEAQDLEKVLERFSAKKIDDCIALVSLSISAENFLQSDFNTLEWAQMYGASKVLIGAQLIELDSLVIHSQIEKGLSLGLILESAKFPLDKDARYRFAKRYQSLEKHHRRALSFLLIKRKSKKLVTSLMISNDKYCSNCDRFYEKHPVENCKTCLGSGVVQEQNCFESFCKTCGGLGQSFSFSDSVLYGFKFKELYQLEFSKYDKFLGHLEKSAFGKQIKNQLEVLSSLGLGSLCLGTRLNWLSTSEVFALNLAKVILADVSDFLLVLNQLSVIYSQSDYLSLLKSLSKLEQVQFRTLIIETASADLFGKFTEIFGNRDVFLLEKSAIPTTAKKPSLKAYGQDKFLLPEISLASLQDSGEQMIIKFLSELEPGSLIAVQGEKGCGKTKFLDITEKLILKKLSSLAYKKVSYYSPQRLKKN